MSQHKIGISRHQMQFSALEDLIAQDNVVRVVDAFVDALDLNTFGFQHIDMKAIGASAFHPSVLLKIYFYGYYNRIRSSRKLEAECTRNIEMKWLINDLMPSYHTISTFRTFKDEDNKINHRKSLKDVFRAFNRFLHGEELFGAETAATDGSKIRAQNARKKNFTEDKIKKKLAIADKDITTYLNELDKLDELEKATANGDALLAYLAEAKVRKDKYEELKKELKNRQEIDPTITQISQTDPEARSIVINNSGHSEIAFNVLSVVDNKNCLVAHFSTENTKDTCLLASSLIATKAEFDNDFAPDLYPNEFVEKELNKELNKAVTVLCDIVTIDTSEAINYQLLNEAHLSIDKVIKAPALIRADKEVLQTINNVLINAINSETITKDIQNDAKDSIKAIINETAFNINTNKALNTIKTALNNALNTSTDLNLLDKSDINNLVNLALNTQFFDIANKLNQNTALNGLADKGFRNGSELQKCLDNHIITYVPPIDAAYSGKDAGFTKYKFIFNTEGDYYTCPDGKILTTNGTLYDKKDRHGVVTNQFQLYKAELKDCKNCPFNDKCITKKQLENSHARSIERNEFEETVNQNDARYKTPEGKAIYKRRQAIVEHPFGTIKRSWGYYYTLLRGIEKVTAEFALVFTTYNMRRAVSILTVKTLINKLKCAKGTFYPRLNTFFNAILSKSISANSKTHRIRAQF